MPERWLIIADDLTGAADSAIAFARRGLRTRLLLRDARTHDEEHAVLSYDADSRRMTPADAAACHRAGLQRFGAPDTGIFKKIDSTLRGHPAAEIAAIFQGLSDYARPLFGVCAPAFPAMGRTTREGRVLVHGKPLEESETWRREHTYEDADLEKILSSAGISAVKVPLARVHEGEERLRNEFARIANLPPGGSHGKVAICDAEEDSDLDIIAAAGGSSSVPPFVIGTAGLAHAISRGIARVDREPLQVRRNPAGALVVVGSLSSVSRGAARQIAAMRGVTHLSFKPQTLLDDACSELRASACGRIARAIADGTDVLVELGIDGEPDLALGPRLAQALAKTLCPVLHNASGLIVTGGETAAALLDESSVLKVDLIDEIETGVTLGIALRSEPFPLVTKAGAFGDAESLVRALEKLRKIRATGILE